MMIYDSIGFDLDGTLWNSLGAITEAWDITAKEFDKPLPSREKMQSVMGLNRKDLMDKLFPGMDDKIQNDFFERSTEICDKLIRTKGGVLYDNLEQTLIELSKKVKLYIVSNCQNGYIEAFLDFHKLGKYFCDYECSGTKCLPKGENIKLVIERNNFKNSIYVGDTQGDKNAAILANVPFVFAEYGFGNVDSYDFIIKKFDEIKELVSE